MRLAGAARIGVIAVCLLAAVAAPALPTPSIPSQPGPGTAPAFVGAAARARPALSFRVPRHPFMAANGRSNMHNDAYMTDAYEQPGPLGRRMTVTSTWLGLEECASITFDRRDRIVALCGSLDGAHLRLMDPVTLETLAVLVLPPRMARPGTTPFTDFCAAGYFYLDNRDRGVVSTNTNQVWIVSPAVPTFRIERTYDLNAHVRYPDCLVSVLPDWTGRWWFVSKGGVVGTIDREDGTIRSVPIPGEGIYNSFAVDETGGVFIVTDHALYRFDAHPRTGGPEVTWRLQYDRGTRLKPGMLSQGSGTSPTLVGRDYVAITDNADPRMHVEVYLRGGAPVADRLVCRTPVFANGVSATDNSLIAIGTSLIVENNYGYAGVQSTAQGGSTTPGIARVDFDPQTKRCRTVWTSKEISPTTVPKASIGSGLVYLYTKPPRRDGVDAWYFTALDFHTGRTVYSRLTGTGYLYNNHYAPITIGPDGAAYVGALGGFIRVADGA